MAGDETPESQSDSPCLSQPCMSLPAPGDSPGAGASCLSATQ